MNNTVKEKIIIPAWNIVKDNTNLKNYYLFPGLLSIIFLTFLLVYQSIYTYVELMGKQEEILILILDFIHSEYIIHVIIAAAIFLLIYFLVMPIFEGGLIYYIQHKDQNKEISGSDAFGMGMYKFLQIFEYNNLFSEFKFISILNSFLFTLRFIGVKYLDILAIVFIIIFFFSVIINILFVYSKYLIVLENKNLFSSFGESSKLAILNIKNTTKLYILMLILNIRVILNFLILLIFPMIISGMVIYISSKIFLILALSIVIILFMVAIYILGYMTAVLDIFRTATWYYAYKVGKEKIKKIENEM